MTTSTLSSSVIMIVTSVVFSDGFIPRARRPFLAGGHHVLLAGLCRAYGERRHLFRNITRSTRRTSHIVSAPREDFKQGLATRAEILEQRHARVPFLSVSPIATGGRGRAVPEPYSNSGHGTIVDLTVFIAMASSTAWRTPPSSNGYSVCISSHGYFVRAR